MTSPSLPEFLPTVSRPRYVPTSSRQLHRTPPIPRPTLDPRIQPTQHPVRRFFERHANTFMFLYSCGLICALVRAAFS